MVFDDARRTSYNPGLDWLQTDRWLSWHLVGAGPRACPNGLGQPQGVAPYENHDKRAQVPPEKVVLRRPAKEPSSGAGEEDVCYKD